MEINDLTEAERRVWEAFPRDEAVDFRESPDEDPGAGASWGPERTVRAEVLRSLLLDGPSRDGEIAGLKVWGARVTGQLDLKYGTVEHGIRLRSCYFERTPELYGATVRALVLSDSVLPGLSGGALRADLVLRLTCCRIAGAVRLPGAQVRALFVNGARLGSPVAPPGEEQPDGEPVLYLNHAVFGTDVWAVGLVAYGQVRLNDASVGGQVNLDDAELYAYPDGGGDGGDYALHAENVSVGSDLRAMRLRTRGGVNLSGARIPRQLNLAYARLSHPGGQALRTSSAVIGELWLREAAPVEGMVNMRRAQIDVLHVPTGVWPGRLRLDGLGYRVLAPHVPPEERLPLLEREETGYLPFAYEQLAAAYRTVGDESAARTVQLAKLRRHRRTLPRLARFWGHLQDVTVGYGFRPMRAAGWLVALLLVGSVAFALERPPPLKADEAPGFNPVFFTLDLLLPIIGFGQEGAFAPQGWHQWLSYLLIVTGWILATTTAAGVSRSLRRQ
ncbi:membrane-associated oxidoreductase [Streptomyces sp. NPDC059828]|uniref:membrane-associated oxidoreductase n=1 Tax=Streptomyces sp. NPDC059828 TaxID=3346965 RepID=UPI00364B316C